MATISQSDAPSTAVPTDVEAGGTTVTADPVTESGAAAPDSGADSGAKQRKRDFFRFGKKGEEEKKQKSKQPSELKSQAGPVPTLAGLRPVSPLISPDSLRPSASPPHNHPYGSPASPGRQLRSASPRTHSPASSLIFERNVQEDAPAQASPQIPSHIITENHIPPALESASEAITNSKLDPDSVEIVTHATHQPAAATIVGVTEPSITSASHEEMPPPSAFSRQDADNVSNYGSLDVGDVRRLSFISFADVVHAEQEQGDPRRDSSIATLSGHSALPGAHSPSPITSPVSPPVIGSSPSVSVTPSVKGLEASPTRNVRTLGTGSPGPVSEVNIETMSQALKKTRSGDLGGFRTHSNPLSPISNPDDDSRAFK